MRQTGFSDVAWGNATRGYATSAHSLSNIKFDVIIQEAQAFVKPIRRSNRTTDTTETINVDDEQACLVDNSDESAPSSGGANLNSQAVLCWFFFCSQHYASD